jgi:hypothetical protein
MAKILVGIASVTPDQRFLESLPLFFRSVDSRHQLDSHWVWNKQLDEAQNELAEKTLDGGYDYLLTIEDDHWGFTAEMLEALLKADTHFCGIPYRSRHYPFATVPMRYIKTRDDGTRLFKGQLFDDGYHESDLVGFGFTLIRKDVFELLERPWFVFSHVDHAGCGPNATDMQFSHRLQQKGIKPMGCWDYFLAHRDITKESFHDYQVAMIKRKNTAMSFMTNNAKQFSDSNIGAVLKQEGA